MFGPSRAKSYRAGQSSKHILYLYHCSAGFKVLLVAFSMDPQEIEAIKLIEIRRLWRKQSVLCRMSPGVCVFFFDFNGRSMMVCVEKYVWPLNTTQIW